MTNAEYPPSWVNDTNAALLTDLYELRMLQAYWKEGLDAPAVFTLYTRELPSARNYLIAAGLADVLRYLASFAFPPEGIAYLRQLSQFSEAFLDWLADLRFTGMVDALPEGTPFFAGEPVLQVTAPLPEAQVVETFILNQIHHQSVMASKAARIVDAAMGKPVLDFGLRRMHGTDAGVKSARAYALAGIPATSNTLAGHAYGLPVAGTMAHSYVQVHASELEAFRRYAELFPDTILLVDTYDCHEGIRTVIQLAREMGDRFAISGIRIDSGDLVALARSAREMLDEAGLSQLKVFVSGSLDEHAITALEDSGAPIDGYGVGTRMAVSSDAPSIDFVYKLSEYQGRGRIKSSPGKESYPGRKQVFREFHEDSAHRDTIGTATESLPGKPLLHRVMTEGRTLPKQNRSWTQMAADTRREIESLPASIRSLQPASPPYPVRLSGALQAQFEALREEQKKSPPGQNPGGDRSD